MLNNDDDDDKHFVLTNMLPDCCSKDLECPARKCNMFPVSLDAPFAAS